MSAETHKFVVAQLHATCWRLRPQLVTTPSPVLAVIDGSLCRLSREGARAASHAPLATAVVEFHHGAMCLYVRENPYGLLPGISNLYCLDGAFRLQWMADWPDASDPCAAIVRKEGDALIATSMRGAMVRLDANTGRLLSVVWPMAAAS